MGENWINFVLVGKSNKKYLKKCKSNLLEVETLDDGNRPGQKEVEERTEE